MIATLGSVTDDTGYPGGLTTDAKHELLANNQFGTIYDLGPFPGSYNPTSTPRCTTQFPIDIITDIEFDARQRGFWTANVHQTASEDETYLDDDAYPWVNGNGCFEGSSGGPTEPFYGDYVSVAVWTNKGQ